MERHLLELDDNLFKLQTFETEHLFDRIISLCIFGSHGGRNWICLCSALSSIHVLGMHRDRASV